MDLFASPLPGSDRLTFHSCLVKIGYKLCKAHFAALGFGALMRLLGLSARHTPPSVTEGALASEVQNKI